MAMIDRGDHDPELAGHADRRDDGVEREDNVEHQDLHDHRLERGDACRPRSHVVSPSSFLVNLHHALGDQEETADQQNEVSCP
jgi:hypothetical protein